MVMLSSGSLLNPVLNPNAGVQQGYGLGQELGGYKSPIILAQSNTPVILLSSGTFADATGSMTGLATLPYVPTGVVQVFVFSGAGIPASGLYFATFSSATACQLWLDGRATIKPTGITPGAYAGGTSVAVLSTVLVPGGLLGNSGALRLSSLCSHANNVNTKTHRATLAGTNVYGNAVTATATARQSQMVRWKDTSNMVFTSGSAALADGTTTAMVLTTPVNNLIDQSLLFTGQLAVATDFAVLEGFTVEALPG